ncbi:MAG: CarD family transcriptional regulator [Hyphomicrobium sp.]
MAQKSKNAPKPVHAKPQPAKKAVPKAPASKVTAKSRPAAAAPVRATPVVAGKSKSTVPVAKAAAKPVAAIKPVTIGTKPHTVAAPARPAAQAGPVQSHSVKKMTAPPKAGQAIAVPPRPQQAAALAKSGMPRITAPVPTQVPAKAMAPKAPVAPAPAAAAAVPKKPVSQRHGFKTNEFVVYPAHGVGRIVGIEEQEIAGMALELFVITFEKEKLTLRVPTGKLASVGMRKLADEALVKRAMETLKGRARIKRTMWSRRAQEYVAKINSGDLIAIAEVVRDLYRSEAQPEQSYSERQLYEDALDRMSRELAAVEKLDERGAVQRITEVLSKSAKGRRVAEEAEAA